MPAAEVIRTPLPLKLLVRQVISQRRAHEMDFNFFKDIANKADIPEFNGYNTEEAREEGHAVGPKTFAVYCPLIDMVPSEPDTILTAMDEAEKRTEMTGQKYTIFTTDQQLYRVVVMVLWEYQDRFRHFIPRLGGMHTLMNFVGAVGTLMANTGLEELLQAAIGSVPKMLSGKYFPQNVRALRMVVEVVLHDLLVDTCCNSYEYLMNLLEERASRSRTAKMWLQNLIKPVFIMMAYVRAERESDWILHLWAVSEMLPYFFASGHFNYARYIQFLNDEIKQFGFFVELFFKKTLFYFRYCLYYLRSMEKLPSEVLTAFLKGHHVMRHVAGVWNAIWSDMFIESTFMRYGHGPGGIVGITLQQSALKRWAYSLHSCSQLTKDVADLKDKHNSKACVMTHKEEMPARKAADAVDREKLQQKLATLIHPLQEDGQSQEITNIATGRLAPKVVNVDQSVEIGRNQLQLYESGWSGSFHKPLTKKTVTMSVSKKQIKVGPADVFDTTLIYSRVLCLQQVHDINIRDVLQYELSPVAPSMFEDNGDIRICKSKATLKNRLQVEVSSRFVEPADVILIDGCAVLWVISWPSSSGTVEDFLKNMVVCLNKILQNTDVYLIFDRYYPNSIKDATRMSRAGRNATRRHQLTLHMQLPPQKVVLTVTENKVQLIDLACKYLTENPLLLPQNGRKLIITGGDPIPVQILLGAVVPRPDMKTLHEEADVVIAKQVLFLAAQGMDCIRVICDDTDVVVLLMHYYFTEQLTCQLYMVGTSPSRSTVDIKATVEKHSGLVKNILAAHALSGCDTVASLYGIGKTTVIKTMQSGYCLEKLGKEDCEMKDIITEATRCIAACYGHGSHDTDNMSALRFRVWTSKMSANRLTSAPELKTIPPTTAAFEQHVRRAHYQTMVWRAAREDGPPSQDPRQFGWTNDGTSSLLLPVALPPDVSAVPEGILKLIKCGCAATHPCATARCSCVAAKLSCSVFCACHAENECYNERTKATLDVNEDDENIA